MKYNLHITKRYIAYTQLFYILLIIIFLVNISYNFIKIPYTNEVSLLLFFLLVIKVTYQFAYYLSYDVEINNEQIIIKEGVFVRKTNYIEIYRLKDYSSYQSLIMRFLKVMSITLKSSDKSFPKFTISGIENDNIILVIRNLVERQRRIKGVREFD